MAVMRECASSSFNRQIFSNKNKNVACSAGKSREFPGQKDVCLFFFKNKQKEKKKKTSKILKSKNVAWNSAFHGGP